MCTVLASGTAPCFAPSSGACLCAGCLCACLPSVSRQLPLRRGASDRGHPGECLGRVSWQISAGRQPQVPQNFLRTVSGALSWACSSDALCVGHCHAPGVAATMRVLRICALSAKVLMCTGFGQHRNAQDAAKSGETSSLMSWGSSDLFVARDIGLLEEESNDAHTAARRRWRPASVRPVRDHREMGRYELTCNDAH